MAGDFHHKPFQMQMALPKPCHDPWRSWNDPVWDFFQLPLWVFDPAPIVDLLKTALQEPVRQQPGPLFLQIVPLPFGRIPSEELVSRMLICTKHVTAAFCVSGQRTKKGGRSISYCCYCCSLLFSLRLFSTSSPNPSIFAAS